MQVSIRNEALSFFLFGWGVLLFLEPLTRTLLSFAFHGQSHQHRPDQNSFKRKREHFFS